MKHWKELKKQNFRSWKTLFSFLKIDDPSMENFYQGPLDLPLRLAKKIEKTNFLKDPILLQFLTPLCKEKKKFSKDPVQDLLFQKEPLLLKKYEQRALLLCSPSCAMQCAFCFRKNFPYDQKTSLFKKELSYISKDHSLHEIILSGGDPLSLEDAQLASLLKKLDAIPHVKRIRLHSRFPIGIPERISSPLLLILKKVKKTLFFVLHTNHPRELDKEVFFALKKLKHLGIPVLTQTVLLKGVNDEVDTLKTLFESLIDEGILPYYLHQLDRIEGSAHFEVAEKKGKELISKLREQLPGYGVPRYVKEIPGSSEKTILF